MAVCVGLLACGEEESTRSRDADTSTRRIIPGRVTLTLERAREESSLVDTRADTDDVEESPLFDMPIDTDDMYVVTRVTIGNGLNEATIASPAVFRLRTDDGLESIASPLSELLQAACPSTAFVGAGETVTCEVAFQVPRVREPTAVIYLGDGSRSSTSEAPIEAFPRCDRCEDVCVDRRASRQHCGACNVAVASSGRCIDGVPTCNDPDHTHCGTDCVDLQRNVRHCGACFEDIGDAICENGAPRCLKGQIYVDRACRWPS